MSNEYYIDKDGNMRDKVTNEIVAALKEDKDKGVEEYELLNE